MAMTRDEVEARLAEHAARRDAWLKSCGTGWRPGLSRYDIYQGRILICVEGRDWWAETIGDVKSGSLWVCANQHAFWFVGDDIENRRDLMPEEAVGLGLINLVAVADVNNIDLRAVRFGRIGSTKMPGFVFFDADPVLWSAVHSDYDDAFNLNQCRRRP